MNDGKSAPFSIQGNLSRLSEEEQARSRLRLGQLESVLWGHNHPLRDDSRLAFLWATERLDPTWDAREVCHEMMSVQFICANTRYNDLIQPFLRVLAKGLRERYGLKSWATTWRIVREYGPDILKLVALVDAGVQIPNFMLYAGEVVPIAPGDAAPPAGGG